MNAFMHAMARFNDRLIRCYPGAFRRAFDEELRQAYREALVDQGRAGWRSLLRFFLRECNGWGRTMIALRLSGLSLKARAAVRGTRWLLSFKEARALHGRLHMTEWVKSADTLNDDKASAWLAGTPLLLFGLGIALNALIAGSPWYELPRWRLYLGAAVGLLPMLAIGAGALLALTRRFPDWGWTWLGATFMGGVIFLKTIVEELADEGRPLLTQGGELALAFVILLVGGGLLLAAALRGWRRSGLLSLGFSGIFGLALFQAFSAGPFFRHDLTLLSAPCGLLAAALIAAFVRGSDPVRLSVVVGMAVFNVGIVMAANVVWREWLTRQGAVSPAIPLLTFSTAMLVAGPLAGWMIRPIRRVLGGAS